jgi:DNA-binding LacI/PurR family transcriptional regulator
VALLSPAPLHRLPTSTIVWIDELRGCLAATGRQLDFCENVASYRRHPQNELEALASRVRPAAWVLYRSTPEIQRWFGEHAPHAVIAGSPHARVGLSSVDVDYAAASRHAAGRFLACGHRRLAIVRGESRLAGDFESVAAFHEACGHEAPSAIHDGSVNGICASLEALFAKAPRPTGLFVFHARPLLTVLGWLQARGLRVPRGVSVLCRDDEPFLDYALPAPARYKLSPTVYARKFCKLVIALAAHGSSQARQVRIIPEFESGATLAAVAE